MTTALLVLDMQNNLATRYGVQPAFLDRLQSALTAARGAGMLVVFVRVGFRAGFIDVSRSNQLFSPIADRDDYTFLASDEGSQPLAALGRQDTEPLVTKLRVSAFAGSDLEVLLRSSNVDHIVLAGVATSGVVLATLVDASDRDYGITVLSDGCLDRDPEVHQLLISKVFPSRARVATIDEWIEASVPEGGNSG